MNGDEGSELTDSEAPPSQRRIIKRYSNRKLYDTKGSSYVTLLQIAEMIRSGEDVQIIDNASKEDKTDITLALIISEELRSRPRAIPLATLKALIRHRGERILSQLREGPIGKLIPKEGDTREGLDPGVLPPEAGDEDMSQGKEGKGLRATLEQWQSAIDERIRTVLPNFAAFRDLELEVRRVSERLDALEQRLADPSAAAKPATMPSPADPEPGRE
ncbi:MAG TPA: polyhydroxyalkanoate synthesis regulator DNA-binding domain-containing protein [Polyangiaceae bacterium]|nr:polyhydroxyalkanoate synthesis regulator DNA-binding domain-containing protein [Polyangiaceae bacterium]